MRILYFSRDYTTHDHRFLSALAQTDHKVYYLRLENRGQHLEDRPIPPGIELINWAGGNAPARLRDGPRLLSNLKRIIQKIEPDLIHAGPIQRSAFLVALCGFRPLVSVSWGYDLLHDAQQNAFWRWATRYTLKRSAVMIGDCDTIRELAISHGMPDERIATFPWGVDLEHFSPVSEITDTKLQPSYASSSTPFTLLSTRGWEPIYGVEVIARAFVQVARQRPELRLVMLGNGSQAARLNQILRQANSDIQPGNSKQVIFPGQIHFAELPRYYRSADLYLAASYSDGASISLIEAMACGCPVLISDIPGNREWIAPGENGWLFPPGDENALASAILNAVNQRDNLPQMGRAARYIAEQRADWKQNFQKLLQAYEFALQNH